MVFLLVCASPLVTCHTCYQFIKFAPRSPFLGYQNFGPSSFHPWPFDPPQSRSQTNPWNCHLNQTTKRVTNYWKNQLGVLIFLVWQASRRCQQQCHVGESLGIWGATSLEEYCFMKVPLKRRDHVWKANESSSLASNHQFVCKRCVMLVFIGVLHFNLVCHKGQWWWMNLHDASKNGLMNVSLWFVCIGDGPWTLQYPTWHWRCVISCTLYTLENADAADSQNHASRLIE